MVAREKVSLILMEYFGCMISHTQKVSSVAGFLGTWLNKKLHIAFRLAIRFSDIGPG